MNTRGLTHLLVVFAILVGFFARSSDSPAVFAANIPERGINPQPVLGIAPQAVSPIAIDDSYIANDGTPLVVSVANGVLKNDTDADGDPLTARLDTPPKHSASFTLNPDGSFNYTHSGGTTSDTFTYYANDGTSDSNLATVTITINAPPVAVGQSISVSEDVPQEITLSGTDANDNPLTFAIVQDTSYGTLGTLGTPNCTAVNSCTVAVTYTPDANNNLADSFTFKVNDGVVDSVTAMVNITMVATNDAPVLSGIEADALGFTEGDPVTIVTTALTVIDVDSPNLASATVSISAGYQNGGDVLEATSPGSLSASFNPSNGILSLTGIAPLASYQAALQSVTFRNTSENPSTATRTISFRVSDGADNSNIATRQVAVTAVNDPPVAVAQSVSVTEDTAQEITLSGTDADDNALTFTIVTPPTHGTLGTLGTPNCTVVNSCTAAVTYTPTTGNNEPDSFTFKVNDGTVDSADATISISMIAVDNPPTLTGMETDALAFAEGGTSIVLTTALKVGDLDNTTLASATVSISAGYQSGADVLVVTLPGSITWGFNSTTGILNLTGTALLTDYQAALRSVTYNNTSENPSTATRSISFVVNDGTVSSLPASRSVTVTAVNDAPVNIVPGSQAVNEDTVLTFLTATGNALSISDVDAGTGSLQVTVSVVHGTLTPVSSPGAVIIGSGTASASITGTLAQVNTALNGLTYQGVLNWNSSQGTETLTLTTNDQGNTGTGGPQSDSDTITITVNAVNDAPTAPAEQAFSTNEDTPYTTGQLLASDVDNLSLTYASVTGPAHGILVITPNTGAFSYTPAADYTGTDTFTFRAYDGALYSNLANVTITINPVNDPPKAQNQNISTNEDTEFTGTVHATDVDSSLLTYNRFEGPFHGTATVNPNGSFSYKPALHYVGTDSFTFKACDNYIPQACSSAAIVSIDVQLVNTAPTAENQAIITSAGVARSGALVGSDNEAWNVLTYRITGGQLHGAVTLNGATGAYTYTPYNLFYYGSDWFTYKVNDGYVDSNEATVSITINQYNQPPQAQDDAYSMDAFSILNVPPLQGVLANDTDLEANPLTAVLVAGPAIGTLTFNPDGSFTYQPGATLITETSFTYKASDGKSLSNVATVRITINPVVLSQKIYLPSIVR